MNIQEHTAAPIARRILLRHERPTHRLLTRAYLEAERVQAEDEAASGHNEQSLEDRADQLLQMGPGLPIEERLSALYRFWGVNRPEPRQRHPIAANDNHAR